MVTKILETKDKIIIPAYVALMNRVLTEMIPYHNEATIQEVRSIYTVSHIEENLANSQNIRFVGHFTEQNLDGILIEKFDELDGNRTTINWVMAIKKGKGIGTNLVTDCIYRAKKEQKDNVSLSVSLKNPRARELYKRLGFISGGIHTNKHNLQMELMGYIFER